MLSDWFWPVLLLVELVTLGILLLLVTERLEPWVGGLARAIHAVSSWAKKRGRSV